MYGEKNSLDLYNKQARDYSRDFRGRNTPSSQDIMDLLEKMKEELLTSSYSALLDMAYNTCYVFCVEQRLSWYNAHFDNLYINEPSRRRVMSTYDAWYLIIYLAEYLSSGSLSRDMSLFLTNIYGGYAPKDPSSRDLCSALKKIDESILIQRKKMYSTFKNSIDGIPQEELEKVVITEMVKKEITKQTTQLMQEAEEKKQQIINAATTQAKQESQTILKEARGQADREKRNIIDNANQQATAIISKAQFTADTKISDAKRRIVADGAKKRLEAFSEENQKMQDRFSDVRNELLQTNEMMKKLEDSVSESMTKKVYTQLIELYNLIADTKDSAFSLAHKNNDQDLENAAYNMDVFLDMIVEYLADFGIQTIASMPGDRFSARIHTIGMNNMQFDPRSTSIKNSLRNGFVWGEQVLQKERVEV